MPFQQAFAGRLQTLDDDLADALHEFIPEVVVFLAPAQQMRAVQTKGPGRFEGPGLEVPLVGGKQDRKSVV